MREAMVVVGQGGGADGLREAGWGIGRLDRLGTGYFRWGLGNG